jgi:isoleucyl-tRNA synthetase
MHRTSEVIDCWFDSGSMPFAQWHYPFENKDRFESELFPADFISEGIDQTRGWFYSMLTISTLLMGKSSFKNCLVNDLILDKSGQKMSKSKGNSVEPMELMATYGADAIRWYLLEVSPAWVPTKFNVDEVKEVVGKFIGTLKNVHSFFCTYANIDNFTAGAYELAWQKTAEVDRWIVSRLQTLIRNVIEWNSVFEFTRSVRAMQDFMIDEVSNWFVRRSRRRFWSMELTQDKIDAYLTLYQVMVEFSRLMAPFAPYLSDAIYQSLTGEESVHLTAYPKAEAQWIDTLLEEEMQTVIDIVSMGRSARNDCQIKVRQPLAAIYMPDKVKAIAERMFDLIQEEINIHAIKYISEDSDFVLYELKPDLKVMGPKYGKHLKALSALLPTLKGGDALAAFNAQGYYEVEVSGEVLRLTAEDLQILIKAKEGYVFQSNRKLWVALDTVMTPELVEEGFYRETLRTIQNERKEQDLAVMDYISVEYHTQSTVVAAALSNPVYMAKICHEALCNELRSVEMSSELKEFEVNGEVLYMKISKLLPCGGSR